MSIVPPVAIGDENLAGSDATADPQGNARAASTPLNLIGWASSNSVGLSVALSIPLWIADFPARTGTGAWSGGVAATLELMAATITNIAWASFAPRYPSRWIAFALALVMAVAQQFAASSVAPLAFAGLAIVGCCSGGLLAILNRQVADSAVPHHNFAILTFLHVGFGVSLYLVASHLQARFGTTILFALLSTVDLAGCALTLFLPKGRALSPRHAATAQSAAPPVLGIVGLAALGSLMMGHEGISAYLVLLGRPLGLSAMQVSHILALASAVGLLGTLVSGLLPPRAGYARLICGALTGMVVLDAMLAIVDRPLAFAMTFVALQTLLVFSAPRIFSYLAMLDHSGRCVGMAPAAVLIGSALGPVMGNLVGAPQVVGAVPFAGATGTALAALLFLATAIRRSR